MGYVWQQTRNVVLDGLVHEAWRDIKPSAEPGRVHLFCQGCFYYTRPKRGHTTVKYTKRSVTCVQCVGSVRLFDDG